MTASETWRPVVGREGEYEVSDLGRVRSLDRVIVQRLGFGKNPDKLVSRRLRGKLLALAPSGPYLTVRLGLDADSAPVQWLVASAFIGPRPPGLLVLHGDGDGMHNAAPNLRYGTQVENMADSLAHGTLARGEDFARSKLTDQKAAAARALSGLFTQYELASMFRVTRSAIQAVQKRMNWKHVPDITTDDALAWLRSSGLGETS